MKYIFVLYETKMGAKDECFSQMYIETVIHKSVLLSKKGN